MQELTSEKIYKYISRHPLVTANELSRVLMLTKADIRYHLSRLVRLGLLARKDNPLKHGAGRPGYYYIIAKDNLKSGYPLLAQICTSIMTNGQDHPKLLQLSKKVAEGFSRNFEDNQKTGAERISAAIQYLNDLGYQAAWEARPAYPAVFLKKCPYLDLAATEPMLCLMDTYLLEKITGWIPTLHQSMNDYSQPSPYCLFTLSESINRSETDFLNRFQPYSPQCEQRK